MTNDDDFNKALERFKIILQTRDFEIEMFWKRCNYFLVLNTALAVGIFASFDKGDVFLSWACLVVICFVGIFVCTAWVKVGLGSKYWQSHWEQVVIQEQKFIGFCEGTSRNYFSIEDTKERVAANLGLLSDVDIKNEEKMGFFKFIDEMLGLSWAFIRGEEQDKYKKLVLCKPSVSNWMHRTAIFFLWMWAVMFVLGSFWALWECGFWAWLGEWLYGGIRALWCKMCG